MTTQKDQLASLIASGGVPPLIGEWALAGALWPLLCEPHRICPDTFEMP